MAQSLNTKVDFTIKATNFQGLTKYGTVMTGDKAFEFYNERNPEDYIQIPWEEISYVSAEVWFNRKITRFAIFIKQSKRGYFSFSTRDNKATLRAVRDHIGADKLFRSPSFPGSVKKGIVAVFTGSGKKKKKEEPAGSEKSKDTK